MEAPMIHATLTTGATAPAIHLDNDLLPIQSSGGKKRGSARHDRLKLKLEKKDTGLQDSSKIKLLAWTWLLLALKRTKKMGRTQNLSSDWEGDGIYITSTLVKNATSRSAKTAV